MPEKKTELEEQLIADFAPFQEKVVVLDTPGPMVYVGKLVNVSMYSLTLVDVDVHDMTDTPVSKEVYIMETRLHGPSPNRRSVHVKQAHVVSLSLLEDVIVF